jgi:fatty acid omega-hydroxylase
MQSLVQKRVQDPFYGIWRMFGLTRRERRIRQLKKILDSHAYEIIHCKRRTAKDGSKMGPDLLSRFIEHSNKNNEPIDDIELRDVIMNILVAGRDTTACALSWTFFELSKRPDVVQRIIEEVNSICVDGDISYENMNRLKYTHSVLLESLRLHPSVPIDSKIALVDTKLPDGTFIPANSGVGYIIYAMGRNKQIWGTDASEFKPERFLDQKEPSMYQYPAFNAGPRLCLGKPLAMITIKMAIAYLLPRYEFVDSLKHPGDGTWTLVLSMKGGYSIDLKKRTK